jgi:hypothetical protein
METRVFKHETLTLARRLNASHAYRMPCKVKEEAIHGSWYADVVQRPPHPHCIGQAVIGLKIGYTDASKAEDTVACSRVRSQRGSGSRGQKYQV